MKIGEVKCVTCLCGNVMECVGEIHKGVVSYRCECGFEADLRYEVK